MQRYKIKIEYDGTPFVGWQFQKNGLSVQKVLQDAIFSLVDSIGIDSTRIYTELEKLSLLAKSHEEKENYNSNKRQRIH